VKFNIDDFYYDKFEMVYRLKDNDRFFISAMGVIDKENPYHNDFNRIRDRLDFKEVYLSLMVADKLKKRKTINDGYSSYSFKHLVERYFFNYLKSEQHIHISNGNSIISLLLSGFDVRFIPCIGKEKIYSHNVNFNVSSVSYDSLSRLFRER